MPFPNPQSINLLKHIQYFVKHIMKDIYSSSSPPWAINSKAFKFYSEDTKVKWCHCFLKSFYSPARAQKLKSFKNFHCLILRYFHYSFDELILIVMAIPPESESPFLLLRRGKLYSIMIDRHFIRNSKRQHLFKNIYLAKLSPNCICITQ